MSTMASELARHRPDWVEIPEELERAWSWLEGQDWNGESDDRLFLGHDSGEPHFYAGLTLGGWFEPDTPGYARLLPLVQAAGDGSFLALWRDDDGQTRVVLLGSEGDGFLVADDARELLTLLAIGYSDITEMELGEAPEEPAPGLDPLRAWLKEQFAITVPDSWREIGDDHFSAWLDRELGYEPPAPSAPTAPDIEVSGEVLRLIDLLGKPDDPDSRAVIADLTGVALKPSLRWSVVDLKQVGFRVGVDRHGIATMWIRLPGQAVGEDVVQGTYPRADALIDGLSGNISLAEAQALLGEPEASGPRHLRYVVRGRYLHLEFTEDPCTLITLMASAP